MYKHTLKVNKKKKHTKMGCQTRCAPCSHLATP